MKTAIKQYLNKETSRTKWCMLDSIVYENKHCQKCKVYHGEGTMTCEKGIYKCVK